MRMKTFLLLLFFAAIGSTRSQPDSILISNPGVFTEGFYLTYEDFRKNKPVTREHIVTGINKEQLDFFGKVAEQPKFSFSRNGIPSTAIPAKCWGYFQNNTLYVNYKETFYKVPVFGSICYLVALVEIPVTYPGYYYPGMGMGMGTTTRAKEMREFVMNFYDGKMEEMNLDKLDLLLSRDEVLYKEWKSLKRRKQKELTSRFIKRFNEAHPVYYLQ
jgi:hypothetical protein